MDTIIAIIAPHLDTLDKDYDVQFLVTYDNWTIDISIFLLNAINVF